MEISRNNRIYRSFMFQSRFVGYWQKKAPDNLCTFVRLYVFRILWNSLKFFFLLFILLSTIWVGFAKLQDNTWAIISDEQPFATCAIWLVGHSAWLFLIIGFCLLIFAIVCLGITFGFEFLQSKRKSKAKEKSILLAWIHAKKNKYCPTITYK